MSAPSHLIDHFKKVCICRSVTGGTIMKAIEGGCLTFESLRRKIRVGTGQCRARRCRHKIEDKLRDYKARRATEAEAVEASGPEAQL